jgi:hypothetical protein
VFQLLGGSILGTQVRLERAREQLQQHLEADLGDGRVVAALAELVADEGVLRPGKLVEAKDGASVAQLLADQVPARVGHVRVLDAKDHGHLALELGEPVERVVAVGRRLGRHVGALVRAQRTAVHVRGKVCDARVHSGVKLPKSIRLAKSDWALALHRESGGRTGKLYRCPKREVSAKAHSRDAYSATASGEAEEVVHGLVRVRIVRLESLRACMSPVSHHIPWRYGWVAGARLIIIPS